MHEIVDKYIDSISIEIERVNRLYGALGTSLPEDYTAKVRISGTVEGLLFCRNKLHQLKADIQQAERKK